MVRFCNTSWSRTIAKTGPKGHQNYVNKGGRNVYKGTVERQRCGESESVLPIIKEFCRIAPLVVKRALARIESRIVFDTVERLISCYCEHRCGDLSVVFVEH